MLLPALDDVSFRIEGAEVCGLLGRNGAGKSTALNILTGCLPATSGSVEIDGIDLEVNPTEAKRRIGYAPELPPLYPDMTLSEYLTFVARAKSCVHVKDEIVRVMEETSTLRHAGTPLRALSRGNRQRAGIAQALLGNPGILILDEPSIGLDPEQITRLRALIARLGRDHTVLLSSHILSEITLLCGRILLLSRGRLVADAAPEELLRRTGKATLEEAFLELTAGDEEDGEETELPSPRRPRGRRKGGRA